MPSVKASSLLGVVPRRNRLMNATFAVNQRGVTSPVTLAAGAYGHDRWKAGAAGCTYSWATVAGLTTITITAGSLVQVIEGNNLDDGVANTYVLSWTGTAQGKIGAGAASASGVTGAADGGTNLSIEFGLGTLAKPQLEPGAVRSMFERRPYGMELALCQLYYWQGLPMQSLNWSPYAAGAVVSVPVKFPVTMRAVPTLAKSTAGETLTGLGGEVFDMATKDGARLLYTSTAASTNANVVFGASDFLSASAEL